MTEIPDDDKYRAPALSKGLDILEMLAGESRGMTQVEIAKALGRTTSEIFRMLMVLRQRGYVELSDDGDRYALTTKMFEIAHKHPPIRRLTAIAGEEMQRLADEINQSLHMAILHSGRVLVIAQVDCQDNNITLVRLGAQIPLFDTASGRVLAAWKEERALAALLEAAEGSEDRRADFINGLPDVREKGVCETPSLTLGGVYNISAPIRDFSGQVVAAMTIPFVERLSGTSIKTIEESREALQNVCRSISRQLGATAHGS
ncbi:MAG: IclR family transcriptional regulator [Rhodobacteraceae bacterium]|nr:IclR family transcriptional regulator [Paracoccaceae bacterium]